MIPAIVALSMLVSSIPAEGRVPADPDLTAPPSATLLEPRSPHPAFSASLLAQADAGPRRTYKKFLIIRQGGERIEGSDGVLDANRLTGRSPAGQSLDIPVGDIQTLYTAQESRVGTLALYGGLTGLAITGLCVLPLAVIPNFFSYDGAVAGTLVALGGGTLIGAGIGALIGLGGNDWQVEPIVAPGKLYVLQLTFKV